QTQPVGFTSVSEDEGGDDNDQSNDSVTNSIKATVTPGENDAGNDFLEEVPPVLYQLSGTVYEDTNAPDADGIEPSDTPIADVTVQLFAADATGQPTGEVITTTTTDNNGNYQFTGLANGDYVVVQAQPAGYESVTDLDGADDNQITATIAGSDSIGNDFLEEVPLASIGGRVWEDRDRNGLEDGLETGVANVTITLLGGGADGIISTPNDHTVTTLTTDVDGKYEFTGLTPGIEYQVTFDPTSFPAEFSDGLTTQDTGSDDQLDSDADINTGKTPIVTLNPGESRTGIDAGLLTPQKDLIEGTASPDNIVGTSIDEIIAGYKGQDTLTGGDGKDSFFYNETSDGVDIITDFTSGEDQIILTQILTEELNYTGNDPIADGYIVIEDYGAVGTMIQIDFDATNDLLPKDVVFLQGVSNLDTNPENDFASQTDLAF
ncbi:MAG: SdrD B-like domain-containing protein, partial [Waterburya sp.]